MTYRPYFPHETAQQIRWRIRTALEDRRNALQRIYWPCGHVSRPKPTDALPAGHAGLIRTLIARLRVLEGVS